MYKTKSPVLFLVFNRPDESNRVFSAIRDVKPSILYFAADGPRDGNVSDIENCAKTKEILSKVDWPCRIEVLIREKNLGCGHAVKEALDWFFNNEPEGIVLEDDCLPNPDFFRFCDLMLDKYRDDSRIGHISGTNLHDNIQRGKASFFFSRLTGIWGWATWARTWKEYDFKLSKLDVAIEAKFLDNLTLNKRIQRSLVKSFYNTKYGIENTWDYQYLFSHLISNRLSLFPNVNLVTNIGFNSNGTHTLVEHVQYSSVESKSLDTELRFPDIILPDKEADIYTLEKAIPSQLIIKWRGLVHFLLKK